MGWVIKTKPLNVIYRELGLDDKGKVQAFLDKTVADNLRKYVSFLSYNSKVSEHLLRHEYLY